MEINGRNTIQIEEAYQCPALIDTGATSTVISQKIADLLKLEEIGKTNIMSASHDFVEVYMYDVAVGISVDEQIKMEEKNGTLFPITSASLVSVRLSAIASKSIEKQGIEMLIGMDLISQGHLTISQGIFIFSIG